MATMSEMSSGGKPTEVKTITMVTRPACGIPAAPMLAAVAVMLRKDSKWTSVHLLPCINLHVLLCIRLNGNTSPDSDELSKIELVLIDLCDEDGSHCLVQRSAIHIDSCTDGKHESSYFPIHVAVFQQTLHCYGQSS